MMLRAWIAACAVETALRVLEPQQRAVAARTTVAGPPWYRWDVPAADGTARLAIDGAYRSGLIGIPPLSEDRLVRELAALRAPALHITLHSDGGEGTAALKLWRVLRTARYPVYVEVVGLVASAAVFVLCAAERVTMRRSAALAVHQAVGRTEGTAAALAASARRLAVVDAAQLAMLVCRTGRSRREVRGWLAGVGTSFTADEALHAGLVDEVTEAPTVADVGYIFGRGEYRRTSVAELRA